jgi:hypothetical protein
MQSKINKKLILAFIKSQLEAIKLIINEEKQPVKVLLNSISSLPEEKQKEFVIKGDAIGAILWDMQRAIEEFPKLQIEIEKETDFDLLTKALAWKAISQSLREKSPKDNKSSSNHCSGNCSSVKAIKESPKE